MDQHRILVVEDDDALREALCEMLELQGWQVEAATEGRDALRRLNERRATLVITDVQMQPLDGNELQEAIRQQWPDLPVIMMTAFGTIDKAVSAMRRGACHYLVKPFATDELVTTVRRYLPQALPTTDPVAADKRSLALLELARRVAQKDVTVMLCGESGTGKEVYARYIHAQSPRAAAPFVAFNCAAIPDNMLEAELFGHEKGAFTGASQARTGKFEQAQGGTLLLDEITEMDLALQAKLLRVLQERELERIGGSRTIELDVRVLATSNRDLPREVEAGQFREDLFYRLNVFPLALPPLRSRPDDILPLARHALVRHGNAGSPVTLSPDAEHRLLAHAWPGNVRELDNLLQRSLVLCDGNTLTADDLLFEADTARAGQLAATAAEPGDLRDDVRHFEDEAILIALAEGCSRARTAAKLGISTRTLRYKIARLRDAGVALPSPNGVELA